jgi:phospholipid/cholesterol/gamma-HCH transport system permease protein
VAHALEMRVGADGRLTLALSGDWRVRHGLATTSAVEAVLDRDGSTRSIVCEDGGLRSWDSALVGYLLRIKDLCADRGIAFDTGNLPAGVARLMALARAVPVKEDAARGDGARSLPERLGQAVLDGWRELDQAVSFLGEIVLGLGRLMVGRARFRRVDFLMAVEDAGARGLPIITIVSLLVGLTVAFVGAIQLKQFGADIYVANLVGLAMTREMASLMTAIVLAGRTGAAYAAQLGTMQGNEEIDALSTIGISPIDFLVLPRVLALALMMPLLFVYSCFLGLLGGYIVGTSMLGLSGPAYVLQTQYALTMNDFWVGFVKSIVFGMLVAYAGAYRGMRAGRSAQAVGVAATSAVVTSIVLIIVVDALFAVMTNLLGI